MVPEGFILISSLCPYVNPFGGWNCDHSYIARPMDSNFRPMTLPKSRAPSFPLIKGGVRVPHAEHLKGTVAFPAKPLKFQ